jgi:TonB family protein
LIVSRLYFPPGFKTFSRSLVFLLCLGAAESVLAQSNPVRVAVLDFGSGATAARVQQKIRDLIRGSNAFVLVDDDLARTAARGAGFNGSLNLTVAEARDLGAAIGCEFFVIGDAQTVRRSPSSGAPYHDSFAAVFIASARTGKLILWERPLVKQESAAAAEQELMQLLGSADTRARFTLAINRALVEEREARAAAVEAPPPIIEVMSDAEEDPKQAVRAPRPYRRLRPPYPQSAAIAEVEAVVDVLLDIDAAGEIGRIEIARWAGYGLDQSVLDTVKQMHFFPAQREGKAIPMRVLLRYNFRKPPK